MKETNEIREYFLKNGGYVSPSHFYDDDGVEGWIWTIGDREFTELGCHMETPEMPYDLVEYIKKQMGLTK